MGASGFFKGEKGNFFGNIAAGRPLCYNKRENKGGNDLRRLMMVLLALALLGGMTCARAEDSFWVEEDEEMITPDPRRQAWALMQLMTKEEKIYQLFFVAPEALTGEKRTAALPEENVFSARPVGGLMLFGQNIESETQLKALTDDLQSQARNAGLYPLFIGVEEEGGDVSRVANKLGYARSPSPETLGLGGDPAQARAAGEQIAGYLTPLGINVAFSPPADTMTAADTVGAQSFGSDPHAVSSLASAMAAGLREGGVIPCYTHFPGHGAQEGAKLGTLSIRRSLEEMRGAEWIPFADGIREEIEMILVSHGIVRAVGDDMPASLSRRVIQGLLRDELGYDGVVVTDSLRMSAVTSGFSSAQAAVQALQAGADILLLPASLDGAVQGISRALDAGELTMSRIEESVERILAVKIRMGLIQ